MKYKQQWCATEGSLTRDNDILELTRMQESGLREGDKDLKL